MNYITVVASSFEEAVLKAQQQYGSGIRVLSRRDITEKGFMGIGNKTKCELTCFLANAEQPEKKESAPVRKSKTRQVPQEIDENLIKRFEREAMTPDPDGRINTGTFEPESESNPDDDVTDGVIPSIPALNITLDSPSGFYPDRRDSACERRSADSRNKSELKEIHEIEELVGKAEKILRLNDFSEKYVGWFTGELKHQLETALPDTLSNGEFEYIVLDKIAGSIGTDSSNRINPPNLFAVLGSAGCGKTTTIAKIAALYSHGEHPRKVRLVSIAPGQANRDLTMRTGKALNLASSCVSDENEAYSALRVADRDDLILIDTDSVSLSSSLSEHGTFSLLNCCERNGLKCFMAVSATMKNADIERLFEIFRSYEIAGIIVTMADMTTTTGNIVSLCHERRIPVIFITDGRRIPKDIHRASVSLLLGRLKGFSIDISRVLDRMSL